MRLLVAALAVLAVAGCGGGEEKPAAALSGEPIPLAQYVARADRICREGRESSRGGMKPLQDRFGQDGNLTIDEVMLLNAEGARLARPIVDRLSKLPPPDSRRADAEAYTRAMGETLDALDDAVDAYRHGDQDKAQAALERNRALAADIVRTAKAVGFKQCGTGFSQ